MSIKGKSGIAVTSSFKLVSESPLDIRTTVDTVSDLDDLLSSGAAYEGLEVYVKGEKSTYLFSLNKEGILEYNATDLLTKTEAAATYAQLYEALNEYYTGDLYITSASGNVIARIDGVTGELSVDSISTGNITLSGELTDIYGDTYFETWDALNENYEDSFYITTSEGNVLAKLDDTNGTLSVENLVVASGDITDITGASITDSFDSLNENYQSQLYITKEDGTVMLHLNGDTGVLAVDNLNTSQTTSTNINAITIIAETISANDILDSTRQSYLTLPLTKWTRYCIGDSLTQNKAWPVRVATKTGITYGVSQNNSIAALLNAEGTTSYGTSFICGVWRVKNLIDGIDDNGVPYLRNDGGKNKVVVIENINDGAPALDLTGASKNPTGIYATISSDNYIIKGLTAIYDSYKVSLSDCLAVETTGYGYSLTVTSAPGVDGSFQVSIFTPGLGWGTFTTNVLSTDTATDIAAKIQEYDYSSFNTYCSFADGNNTTVIFGSSWWSSTIEDLASSSEYSKILNDTTGALGYSISVVSDAKRTACYVYYGTDTTEASWTDTTNWKAEFTYSSAYKTQIETIQRNYPYTKIVLTNFPSFGVSLDTWEANNYFVRSYGTLDMEAWKAADTNTQKMIDRATSLKTIAEYYNVYFLDVYKLSGISLSNYSTYYNYGNVHPKNAGYYRLGDVVASYLVDILLKEGDND